MLTYSNAAIELGVRPPSQKTLGYAQWATWIASDIDGETFVFRKFDKLAALNLLYLQSEMLEIESDLSKLDEEILQRPNIDVATINALRRFESLLEQSEEGSIRDLRRDEAQTRMKLVRRLRTHLFSVLTQWFLKNEGASGSFSDRKRYEPDEACSLPRISACSTSDI